MAQQTKAQDAVAAAMSAIEEALNRSAPAKAAAPNPLPNIAPPPAQSAEHRAPEPLRTMPLPIKAPTPAAETPSLPPLAAANVETASSPALAPSSPPANDDRPSGG